MRLLGGLGDDRVEAGLPQQHLQRAHDLGLVVADEHARPALARSRRLPPRAARSRTRCPGRAATRRRSGRRWPRRIRGRSRGPGRRRRGRRRRRALRWNASNTRSRSWSGMPGPAVDHADHQLAPDPAAPDRDRVAARMARGVLDHVDHRALELRPVRAHQRGVAVDRELGPVLGRDLLDRGLGDLLDRGPVAVRLGRPRLEPARGRAGSRPRGSACCPRSPIVSARAARSSSLTAAEPSASPAARIAVSGERRSCETERSSAVFSSSRAPQRPGLDRLGLERLALAVGLEQPVEVLLGLAASLLGLGRPRPRELGQPARHDRGDEEGRPARPSSRRRRS